MHSADLSCTRHAATLFSYRLNVSGEGCGSGRRSPQAISFAGDLLNHGVISELRLIGAVKRQCRSARTVRVGSDPGVFVRESPGLNRGTAWTMQAPPNHAPIHLCLAKKIVVPHQATRVQGEGHVEFRDVNLNPQRGQTRDIGGDGRSVEVKLRDVQLQADSIDGDGTTLEILHHRVDRIGLAVEPFALRFAVEEQRLRVSLMRPAKSLLDIRSALSRQSDAGLVVPERILDKAARIQSLIHHIPGEDLAGIGLSGKGTAYIEQAFR